MTTLTYRQTSLADSLRDGPKKPESSCAYFSSVVSFLVAFAAGCKYGIPGLLERQLRNPRAIPGLSENYATAREPSGREND